MAPRICLQGGQVFDGENWIENGSVLFEENGPIILVSSGGATAYAEKCYNLGDFLIIPGLVDLHSDALEKYIEIRPGVFFDEQFALENLDRRAAGCGITTIYHSISFGDEDLGIRSPSQAESLVRLVHQFAGSPFASIRHKIHGRYEIGSEDAFTILIDLLKKGFFDLVSIMDHTPGQGQFNSLESYLNYYSGTLGIDEEHVVSMALCKQLKRKQGWQRVREFARSVQSAAIPLLSHDDDSPEKVSFVRRLGAVACEFPVRMDAAKEAAGSGMKVFMGAPNAVRGRSSNNNLRACDAVLAGICHGLVSDYYPETLIQAPFVLAQDPRLPLHETIRLVTSGPGDFAGVQEGIGRLKPGSPADIVVLDLGFASGIDQISRRFSFRTEKAKLEPWVRVYQTWASGRLVYQGPCGKGSKFLNCWMDASKQESQASEKEKNITEKEAVLR